MKLNDILYSSWGYDQTNVDFYQVIKVSGSFVTVIEIQSKQTLTGDMNGTTVPVDPITPVKDAKPMRRKLIDSYREKGTKDIRLTPYSFAQVWDGRPKQFSCWA